MELRAYASTRFGQARRTPGRDGHIAFFPAAIPRALEVPAATVRLLADAEAALGRLAGVGQLLPKPASSCVVEARLHVTRPTALKLLRQLEGVGVLQRGAGGPRGQRRYLARELMAAVADEGAGTSG